MTEGPLIVLGGVRHEHPPLLGFQAVPGCDPTGLLRAGCDDANPEVNPGEAEVCNRRDDNCDLRTGEGFPSNPEGGDNLDNDGNGLYDDCDGTTDETTGSDGDGIGNPQDNCPDTPKPAPENTGQDGIGDAGDPNP